MESLTFDVARTRVFLNFRSESSCVRIAFTTLTASEGSDRESAAVRDDVSDSTSSDAGELPSPHKLYQSRHKQASIDPVQVHESFERVS